MPDETPLSVHHPAEGLPIGGVIVIQEVFGVTDHIEDVCARIAEAGWLTVAPHLFWRTGDPVLPYDDFSQVAPHAGALKAEDILVDVDAALDYLAGAGLPAESVGIVGFCMGGTVAFAVAAQRAIGAAVSFYGGGIDKGRFGFPSLLELAPELKAPWLGLYGEQDQGIPVAEVDALAAAVAEIEVPTEIVRYPQAGHAFNREDGPSYDAAAASDAWLRMLDWFADNLTTGATESPGL